MKTALSKAIPASIAALAVSAFLFAPLASAASLTSAQVSAILSLVASFGADSATIANVQASLTGTPAPASVSGSVSGGTPTTTAGSPSVGTGASGGACVTLTHSFGQGATDVTTGGDVTRLQQVLVNAGFLTSTSATGFYGPLTASAVAKFQTANGVSAVGLVGPATRALLTNRCMHPGTGAPMGGPTSSSGATSGNASGTAAAFANIDGQLQGLGTDLGGADDATSQNDNDQ